MLATKQSIATYGVENSVKVREINGLSLYFAGEVAIVVMDRGENRINYHFLRSFNQLLDIVEGKESCKGLITTGTGKFFSNGLDLEWRSTLSVEERDAFSKYFTAFTKRLLFFPLPTLAALNGHTFAAGAILAFVHDLRTMRIDKGWICFNEVFIGMQISIWAFKYLRVKIGHGKNFSDALVLGHRFASEEAFNIGFVSARVPPNLLMRESVQVLKSFYGRGYPRSSLSAMKEDVYGDALEWYQNTDIDCFVQQTFNDHENSDFSEILSKL